MKDGRTLAIVYWNDPINDPGGFDEEVMPLDEAVARAKQLTEVGFECWVYKLVETHYFKGKR